MPTCTACNTTDPEIYVGFSKTECTNRKCVCFVEQHKFIDMGYPKGDGYKLEAFEGDREEAVRRYFVDTVHNVRFLDDDPDDAQRWADYAKHIKRVTKQ